MNKFRRVVGILLIIIGMSIVGDVIHKKIMTIKKQKEIVELFENGFSEGISTGEVTESNESVKLDNVNLDEINGYKPIAMIEIPSINLSQALVEGITDDVLQYFLGHFPDSAKAGEVGNFAIAGHRVSDYTDAFINLYKVSAGDEIIVKTHNNKYTYVIEENFIVNPDQVEVLDPTDNATITLITCTVGSKQRVIVKGTLQSTEDL
ncbi:MAG: class D sortase [Clostridium sp.]|nr:class D sortase [Clostridium sp.]